MIRIVTRRVRKSDIYFENGVGGTRGYFTKASEKECYAKHKSVLILDKPKWMKVHHGVA